MPRRCNFGFHSVGSRSEVELWRSVGILEEEEDADVYEAPVGMQLGRIGRGDGGAELGGEIVGVVAPAERERGLQESFRRHLSTWLEEKYKNYQIAQVTHASLQ